jgi:hypothetical protein
VQNYVNITGAQDTAHLFLFLRYPRLIISFSAGTFGDDLPSRCNYSHPTTFIWIQSTRSTHLETEQEPVTFPDLSTTKSDEDRRATNLSIAPVQSRSHGYSPQSPHLCGRENKLTEEEVTTSIFIYTGILPLSTRLHNKYGICIFYILCCRKTCVTSTIHENPTNPTNSVLLSLFSCLILTSVD